jgi:hypothetical protein
MNQPRRAEMATEIAAKTITGPDVDGVRQYEYIYADEYDRAREIFLADDEIMDSLEEWLIRYKPYYTAEFDDEVNHPHPGNPDIFLKMGRILVGVTGRQKANDVTVEVAMKFLIGLGKL